MPKAKKTTAPELISNDISRAVTALIWSAHRWHEMSQRFFEAQDVKPANDALDARRADLDAASRLRVAGGFSPLNVDEIIALWK